MSSWCVTQMPDNDNVKSEMNEIYAYCIHDQVSSSSTGPTGLGPNQNAIVCEWRFGLDRGLALGIDRDIFIIAHAINHKF